MKNKYLKAIILILLVLMMCFNSLSVVADNAEKKPSVRYETYINPRYAHLISPEDIEVPQQSPGKRKSYAKFYANLAQAREDLVAAFAKRQAEITFSVPRNFSLAEIVNEMAKHTGNPVGGDYLAWSYGYANAEISWGSGNNYTYTIRFHYYSTAAQEKKLDSEIVRLMNSLDLDGLSEYQKIAAIYNYICSNITYDYEHDDNYEAKFTAYAALVDKTAVCQGYATLFYRMSLMAGLDARCIVNDTHEWNIVRINDKYYNLDVTWDADCRPYEYCLRNNANFPDHERDPEYNTVEFNLNYPMSETDYPLGYEWNIDDNGVMTVKGPGICSNYSQWENNDDIKKVVLERVESLGKNAFANCPNITGLEADGYLYEIQDSAFSSCTSLKKAVLPDSVVRIGTNVFAGCSALEDITLPDRLEELGGMAFIYCTSLRYIYLPSGLKSIGYLTFGGCDKLKNVILPEGVETIGAGVFADCSSLERVYIPASVNGIHNTAFPDTAFTVYGYKGSAAENFAKRKRIDFVAIDRIPCDINGDGNLTRQEVSDLLEVIKGKKQLTDSRQKAADVYGNDGIIDIRDYCAIFDFVGGVM